MRSVKVNLFFNTLLNISKVVFPLITAPYVARVVDANDLGLFNFANVYASYFTLVAMLGIPLYGAREVAKVRDNVDKTNKLFSELFSITVINTLFTSFIYLLSLLLIDRLSADYTVFIILGISLYCSPLNIDWFYGGLENFKLITFRSLIVKILSLVFLFVFVKNRNDFYIYLWISVFYTVANDIWNFVVLFKLGYKIKLTIIGLRKHIKPLLILFASSLAVSVYTMLDTVMLGFLSAYVEVAYYSYAMHMSKALLAAITSLSAVAVPRISYYMGNNQYKEINDLVSKSLSFVSFLAFPLFVIIVLLSPIFIPLFLGAQFVGSVLPLQILSSLLVFIGLNNLFGTQCLVGLGYYNLLLYSVLAGTITNFILNIILIPLYGAVGASIASAFAEMMVLLFTLFFVVKYTTINICVDRDILKTIFSTILIIPVFFILNQLCGNWTLVLSFSIISFSIYLGVQKLLSNKTVLILENLISKKLKIGYGSL